MHRADHLVHDVKCYRLHDCAASPPVLYQGTDSFYNTRGGRLSRELDFGVWWREGRGDPPHRISWVADTGDVYALNHWAERDGTPAIELLGIVRDEAELERRLEGWAEQCGQAGSLSWARARIGGAA